jgi:hypothetical protein
MADLTYHAERGHIVDVLAALTNPHLKTLVCRMLADYAKMPSAELPWKATRTSLQGIGEPIPS